MAAKSTSPAPGADSELPIVIAGAGIIGATIALRLAYAGRKVVVVGSTPTATNMAFGWLGGHMVNSPLRHMLNRLSRMAWEALLDTHLGRDGYVGGGCLLYAADDSSGGTCRLASTIEHYRSLGFAVHDLSREEIASRAPALASRVHSAALLPDDAVVEGRWACCRALERAAEFGADIRSATVVGFERNSDGSVAAVKLSDGTVLACSQLVLAAGGKGIQELSTMLGFEIPIKGVWGIKVKTKPLARRLVPGTAMLKHYCAECKESAGISYGQYPDNSFCINEKFMSGVDMEVRLREWLDYFGNVWPELRHAEISYMTKTVRWVPQDDGHICGFAPAPNSNVYVVLTNSDGINMSALLSEVAATELCVGTTGLMGQCLPGRFLGVASALAEEQCRTIENVGVLIAGKFACPECKQKFDGEKALEIHWRFVHDPDRLMDD